MSDKEGDDDEFFDAEAGMVGDNSVSGNGSGNDNTLDDSKAHDHDDDDEHKHEEPHDDKHDDHQDRDEDKDGHGDDVDKEDITERDDAQESGHEEGNDGVAEPEVPAPPEPPKEDEEPPKKPTDSADAADAPTQPQPEQPQPPSSGVLDFSETSSLSDILAQSDQHLDALFPGSTDLPSRPAVTPITPSSAIFQTDRSRSLWSQLIVPPPLQPPNWVKSRIRRLFLVSLGVPVDLDEILPEKKQKKLVLSSVIDFTDPLPASTSRAGTPVSTSVVGAGGTAGTADGAETPGSPPPPPPPSNNAHKHVTSASASAGGGAGAGSSSRPNSLASRASSSQSEFDIASAQRLASTTETALDGLTDEELAGHVGVLRTVTQHAGVLLAQWRDKRRNQVENKEAFEGVIENLVRHARQARK